MGDKFIDPAALDELRSLERDNPGFLRDIVHQFLEEDAPARLAAIRAAYDGAELAQVGREAHGLKNSCSVVGASLMRDICQEIERGVRQEPHRTGELVQKLLDAFDVIAPELRTLASSEN